jgi:hypothetical protein
MFLLKFFIFFSSLSFSGVTQWIDFKLVDGHVKILVAVSGIDGYAILDTGAKINRINSAFIQKMALNLTQEKKLRCRGFMVLKPEKLIIMCQLI